MSRQMTKSEIRAWKDRWKTVNEFTLLEARALTPDQRLRELETLFDFAYTIHGPKSDEEDAIEVRQRWLRLKEKARDR